MEHKTGPLSQKGKHITTNTNDNLTKKDGANCLAGEGRLEQKTHNELAQQPQKEENKSEGQGHLTDKEKNTQMGKNKLEIENPDTTKKKDKDKNNITEHQNLHISKHNMIKKHNCTKHPTSTNKNTVTNNKNSNIINSKTHKTSKQKRIHTQSTEKKS
ncbi:hypothetical protein [Lysinibacillus fusiformis]|uniref:hypothetical protein n=1 Tax=Lysinibacillus fusiformis TaxID=28031 RepID=UPI000B7E70FB|nr:hypothetical protein [Lysinibacillus fusiformis]